MTTATIQDEDLIILNDETSTNDDIFNFSPSTNSQETSDIVDFSSSMKQEVDDISDNFNIDFSFDSKETSETLTSDIFEEKADEIKTTDSLDFGLVSEINEIKEEKNEDFSLNTYDNLGDMNSILDETIKSLSKRKNIIEDEISKSSETQKSLEQEVRSLQEKISNIKASISESRLESEKIDTNIAQIEKMKEDNENVKVSRKHELEKIKTKK